jgi:hypothetical protein
VLQKQRSARHQSSQTPIVADVIWHLGAAMDWIIAFFMSNILPLIRRIDASVIFTVIVIIPAYWQAIISRRTAKRQLRAYMSVGMSDQGLNKDLATGKWVIKFHYVNDGQTPAYNVTISTSHIFAKDMAQDLPLFSKPYSMGTLGPQDEVIDWEVTELTDSDVELLTNGKHVLLFRGIIRYIDVFKHKRYTKFNFFTGGSEPYNGPSGTDLILCSGGNDAN